MKAMGWVIAMSVAVVGCKREEATKPASASASGTGTASASASATATATDAGTGSGTGSGTASGPPGGLREDIPDAFWDGDCAKVITKLASCARDKTFRDAVTADATTKEEQQEILGRADVLEKLDGSWCKELASVTLAEQGFLDARWDGLARPDTLATCAALAAQVDALGGLPDMNSDVDE
jgi:hypothetical protein